MAVPGYGVCVLVVSLTLLQVHFGLGLIKEKPDWIKTCFYKQPDFEECNKESVQGIFSKLSEGFQEAGVLPLDPLHVTEISILQGNDGPVAVNASLTQVVIRGLSAINVTNNKVDYRTFSFTTEMTVPKMRVEGNYTLQGKILLLPLVGKGDAWFEPYNMKIKSHHDIVLKKKDGQIIFDVRDVTVTFDVSNLKMRLNNLYNGRKALEDSTNSYINANWRAVSESLKPILEKTCSDVVFTIMKNLFDNTPAHWYIGDAGVE
uniref:Uncharacterized protein n=1 Tax=Timema cristinae TaxID=61476 RepID=A0A7R9D4J2_TIMCR|nr:unnamed protein product [Timema cristinae]